MRTLLCIIIAGLFAGCATKPDPINHLVADLSSTHGFWINGIGRNIQLPKTASTEQLVEQVFKITIFQSGRVTSYKILKIRQVEISVSQPESYTAVLCQTSLGEKIVLLRFQEHFGSWWNRVYDAGKTYYEKKSA
ncbi:MAG: hypothetical protein ACREFE_20220 [Limisphaerales bacterium]